MQNNGLHISQPLRLAELAAEAQKAGADESAHLPLKGGPVQLATPVLTAAPADAGPLDPVAVEAGPSQRPGSISGTTRLPQQEAEQPADMMTILRAGGAARSRQDEDCGGRTGEPSNSPGTAALGKQVAGSLGRFRGVLARSKSRAAKRRRPAGASVRFRELQAGQPLGGLLNSSALQNPLPTAVRAAAHAAGGKPMLTYQDRPEQVPEAAPPAAGRRPSQLKVSLCDRGEELATVSLRWDPSRTVKTLHGEGTGQLCLALHLVAT